MDLSPKELKRRSERVLSVYPLTQRGIERGKPQREEEKILSEKILPQDIFEGYEGRNERLYSYATLLGIFNLIFATFLLVAKGVGRPIPERLDFKDIALLGVATHKLSLTGAEDAVTSPLRAPFTEFQEKESPKSVQEKPRGEGLRRSIGELVTCQFCLGMWIAAFFTYGLVLAPRVTRLLATILVILTISDHLHQTYKALVKRA
ncbi:MAG: hypothetical protein QOI57_2795 [Rubrobacteraceae bacterium]|jgi:hypothetical protein|nr:hypothetical protein [Rubrobacteraceae bacterium]